MNTLTNAIMEEVRAILHEAGLFLHGIKNPYLPDSLILSFLIKSRVRLEFSRRRDVQALNVCLLVVVLALAFYLFR